MSVNREKLSRRTFIRTVAGFSAAMPAILRGATPALKQDLSSRINGEVLMNSDLRFRAIHQRIWNALVPERVPACIVRAVDVNDVVQTIRYANQHSLKVAVRCGGHNWYGASLREGGILLDISLLHGVRVDKERREALILPAVNAGQLSYAAQSAGFAFPVAHCGAVTMSGYLLNGGWGWNCGAWGVACGRIQEVELVTAAGERILASEDRATDLFWATRGVGPGSFAVTTSFRLRLEDMPRRITMTNYFFAIDAMEEVSRQVDKLADNIPLDVELSLAVVATPAGFPVKSSHIGLVSAVAFVNSERQAKTELDFLQSSPLRKMAAVREEMRHIGFSELLESVNVLFPPKARLLGENMWTNDPLKDFVPSFSQHVQQAPSRRSFFNMLILPKDRVPLPDAAVSMCEQKVMLWYSIWENKKEDSVNRDWMTSANQRLQSHAAGRYIGETDLQANPHHAAQAYSAENWSRLQSLRKQYDPSGLFHNFLGNNNA